MTNEQWITILSSILGSGAITAILGWWFTRRKTEAETKKIETSIGDDIFNRQQVIIDRQDARLMDQDTKISNLVSELSKHTKEVVELRLETIKTKRYEAALVYLVNEVKNQYPVAVQIAEKIANGELLLAPPLGNGS